MTTTTVYVGGIRIYLDSFKDLGSIHPHKNVLSILYTSLPNFQMENLHLSVAAIGVYIYAHICRLATYEVGLHKKQ